jgi:cell division protease FtsH
MITQLQHKELLEKKARLQQISAELKQAFIGLDEVIDEVMGFTTAWYMFPQAQLRPTVINLWGMTGSGKTALVQKLVDLLDYKKLYVQMDMGEFESDSASWIKSTFTSELEFFHEHPAIICLDEFQFARTVQDGSERNKDKLRVIWDLLDSGRITYIPGSNTYQMRRAESCLFGLLRAQESGVGIERGTVVREEKEFLELFKGFYWDNEGRSGNPLDKDYFLSDDFVQGLYYLYDDDVTTREILKENIQGADLEGIMDLIVQGMKTRTAVKQLDLSRSLIFVLGNLDEAYHMSHSLNPDVSADELRAATMKINVSHIKSALKKRFRNEQVARLGNNHVIYRSFGNAHFRELIARELKRIGDFVQSQFGFSLLCQPSVEEIVYREGVFPAQGTRPLLTTIKNLVESWISRVVMEVVERNPGTAIVEWSYGDDKYGFIFKDALDNVLNTSEEKVNLKIDSLRKMSNPEVQAHTAVHESGHAVLAALSFRILPSVVVSKTADGSCEGFCMINLPEGLTTKETLKKDIIVTLGGFVAEKMIFGEEHTSSGVYSDLEEASSLANRAIKYYGMGSDPLHIAVECNDKNEAFFNTKAYTQEAIQLIEVCCKEAGELLMRNKLLLLKMAEYLSTHNRMEEDMIGEYVKRYSVEPWVNESGFVKKEEYFSFGRVIKNKISELMEGRGNVL